MTWTATDKTLGLDATGQADCYPAIRAWLDALPWVTATGPHVRAGVLELGPGRFRLSQTLTIDRSITLRGVGGAMRKPATVLDLAVGASIVVSHKPNAVEPSGYGFRGEDVCVHSSGGAHALDVRTACSLARLFVVGAQGSVDGDPACGVRLLGSGGEGNVNGVRLDEVRVEDCARGFWIYGGDANAFVAQGCSAMVCAEGYRDESFLGGVWVGCSTEGHTTRGWYVADQAGGSALVRCYSEAAAGASQDVVEPPAQVWGGSWSKGIGARPAKVAATWWNGNQARGRFVIENAAAGGASISRTLGGSDGWHLETFTTAAGVMTVWFDGAAIKVTRGAWNGPTLATIPIAAGSMSVPDLVVAGSSLAARLASIEARLTALEQQP